MDPICDAIQRNGLRCTARHNDGSGRCGRHGGLPRWLVRSISRENQRSWYRPRVVKKNLTCDRGLDCDCFVCLEKIPEAMVLPCCKQTACSDCLRKWFINNVTCPHCRCNLYQEHATLDVV
jgi:hypothetical protein